eukprot:8638347-Alexandrium_andersonii.AAC.1
MDQPRPRALRRPPGPRPPWGRPADPQAPGRQKSLPGDRPQGGSAAAAAAACALPDRASAPPTRRAGAAE